MRRYLVFLALVLAIQCAHAATVHGTLYEWSSLERIGDVIVEVDSTPSQQYVSKDGSYSFELPEGSYVLKASCGAGDDALSAEENVTIKADGEYVLDLVLFPDIDLGELDDFPEVEVDVEDIDEPVSASSAWDFILPGAALLVLAVAAMYLVHGYRCRRECRPDAKYEKYELYQVPEDLRKVLVLLRDSGGRMTQKELREKTGHSEAKVSLMIADLEERGLVKKFKKGRGNVVVLEGLK